MERFDVFLKTLLAEPPLFRRKSLTREILTGEIKEEIEA